MEESQKVIVALAGGVCVVAIILFEVVKRMEPEITLDKLAALGVAACCLISVCVSAGWRLLPLTTLWLAFALGMVWFGEVFGEYRGGRVKRSSPGSVVRWLGWLFLVLPIGYAVYSGIAK